MSVLAYQVLTFKEQLKLFMIVWLLLINFFSLGFLLLPEQQYFYRVINNIFMTPTHSVPQGRGINY